MRAGTTAVEDILVDDISDPRPKPASHPIIKAFGKIQYGELYLKDPQGHVHKFLGPKVGPVAYLYLNDWRALDALLARGEMGFAEAYMERLWDSPDLPVLLTFGLTNAEALEEYFYGRPLYAMFTRFTCMLRDNTIRGSKCNVAAHYDLGNAFYQLWLDKGMTYSCALFSANLDSNRDFSLEEAQQAKYDRILNQLGARAGDCILDIGCGWGGFAEVAARKGIRVTGITISEEQKTFAEKRLHDAGLARFADIRLEDYRQVEGIFDHVVSIGMFEHVGENHWPAYFKTIKSRLKPDGKAMVQCITIDAKVFERTHGKWGFIEQYIFPGGVLPPKPLFRKTAEEAGLACKGMFAFGQDYAVTTGHWLRRFNEHEDEIRALGYDDSFICMWRMYLASCIAAFTTGRTDVMQVELAHKEK